MQSPGSLRFEYPTDAHPSQRSLGLADALEGLCAPPGRGLWDPSPDEARAKWLGELDDALEHQAVTTKEWARLLTTFGRLASARGWMGADGQQGPGGVGQEPAGVTGGRG